MNKEQILEIVESCIKEDAIRKDLEVLTCIINGNDMTPNDLILFLHSISKNLDFFRKELNYPLQLSNLLLFELDAREIKSNSGRGSSYRIDLIQSYKKFIQ